MLAHVSTYRETWLQHCRLGHPSSCYLRILFPIVIKNKTICCDTYIVIFLQKPHAILILAKATNNPKSITFRLTYFSISTVMHLDHVYQQSLNSTQSPFSFQQLINFYLLYIIIHVINIHLTPPHLFHDLTQSHDYIFNFSIFFIIILLRT